MTEETIPALFQALRHRMPDAEAARAIYKMLEQDARRTPQGVKQSSADFDATFSGITIAGPSQHDIGNMPLVQRLHADYEETVEPAKPKKVKKAKKKKAKKPRCTRCGLKGEFPFCSPCREAHWQDCRDAEAKKLAEAREIVAMYEDD